MKVIIMFMKYRSFVCVFVSWFFIGLYIVLYLFIVIEIKEEVEVIVVK